MDQAAAYHQEQRVVGAIEEIGHFCRERIDDARATRFLLWHACPGIGRDRSYWLKRLMLLARICQGCEVLSTDRTEDVSRSAADDRCECGLRRLRVNNPHQLIVQVEELGMRLSLCRRDEELRRWQTAKTAGDLIVQLTDRERVHREALVLAAVMCSNISLDERSTQMFIYLQTIKELLR